MEITEAVYQKRNQHKLELNFTLKKLTLINALCHLTQKIFALSFYANPLRSQKSILIQKINISDCRRVYISISSMDKQPSCPFPIILYSDRNITGIILISVLLISFILQIKEIEKSSFLSTIFSGVRKRFLDSLIKKMQHSLQIFFIDVCSSFVTLI